MTQRTTIHGGGPCFSNLSPGKWSIQRVPYQSWSTPDTQFFQLGIDAPEISARTIASLLIVGIVISALIVLLLTLARCTNGGRWTNKTIRVHSTIPILQTLCGFICFACVLAGAALTRVQVSNTFSKLLLAEQVKGAAISEVSQAAPERFWGVVWSAVGLLGFNFVVLAVNAIWYSERK